jgi:hypothetical protein
MILELTQKLFLSTLIVDAVISELRWRRKSRGLKKYEEHNWNKKEIQQGVLEGGGECKNKEWKRME